MIAARWVRSRRKASRLKRPNQSGDHQHDREGRTEQQSQAPVHPVEDGENAEEANAVVEEGDDDRGEHFIHVLDVVGEAGDQPPHRVRVEKSQIQAQHVSEKALANGVHDVLSGPFQGHDLEEIGDKTDHDHHQKDHPSSVSPDSRSSSPRSAPMI